jgi:hypothetical protein
MKEEVSHPQYALCVILSVILKLFVGLSVGYLYRKLVVLLGQRVFLQLFVLIIHTLKRDIMIQCISYCSHLMPHIIVLLIIERFIILSVVARVVWNTSKRAGKK